MAIEDKFIVSGVVHWAFIRDRDQNDKFSLDFLPDEKSLKVLQARGVNTYVSKTGKYGGQEYYIAKSQYRPQVLLGTDVLNPPKFDEDNKFIDEYPKSDPRIPLIGNGSSVRLEVNTFPTEYKKKKYVQLGLLRMRITNLIEYVISDPLLEDDVSDETMSKVLDDEIPF